MVTPRIRYRSLNAGANPGRFFAVIEMKLMLAFTLLRYDIKTKDGKRPPDRQFYWYVLPDMKAEILFRRRFISQ